MKLAVWGAGLIGRKHAELAANLGVLDAIVDPSPTAAKLAQELGCAHFLSAEESLARQVFDGVVIATPNQLHVAHARLCLAHRLPIMIEKPIADVSADAAALVSEAEAQGVPILVAHHRRHNPISQRARLCIEEGDIGRILAVSGHFLLYKPDGYFENVWRQRAGAGPIFINLIHDVDLLRYFVGEIAAVRAVQSSAARGFEVEDTAAAILEFENGALGTFVLSDTASAPWSWEFSAGENPAYPHLDVDAYRLAGTHGALSVPDLRLWKHTGKRSWWEPMEVKRMTVEEHDPLERQLRHFLEVCQGASPLVSGRDGLRSLQVVEAIKAAADTGFRVPLVD